MRKARYLKLFEEEYNVDGPEDSVAYRLVVDIGKLFENYGEADLPVSFCATNCDDVDNVWRKYGFREA